MVGETKNDGTPSLLQGQQPVVDRPALDRDDDGCGSGSGLAQSFVVMSAASSDETTPIVSPGQRSCTPEKMEATPFAVPNEGSVTPKKDEATAESEARGDDPREQDASITLGGESMEDEGRAQQQQKQNIRMSGMSPAQESVPIVRHEEEEEENSGLENIEGRGLLPGMVSAPEQSLVRLCRVPPKGNLSQDLHREDADQRKNCHQRDGESDSADGTGQTAPKSGENIFKMTSQGAETRSDAEDPVGPASSIPIDSLFLPESDRVSFVGALKSSAVYRVLAHSWGTAFLLCIAPLLLALLLRFSVGDEENFVSIACSLATASFTCAMCTASCLVRVQLYSSHWALFRHCFGILFVVATAVVFLGIKFGVVKEEDWAVRRLDIYVIYGDCVTLIIASLSIDVFGYYRSPTIKERFRATGRNLPSMTTQLVKILALLPSMLITVCLTCAFLTAVPLFLQVLENSSQGLRAVVLCAVFVIKMLADFGLRMTFVHLAPKKSPRLVDNFLFACGGLIMWGMRMVLAGSQDVTFTVVGGVLFTVGELVVLNIMISRTYGHIRNARTERQKKVAERRLAVELINFHGDVILEVFMCVLSFLLLFMYRDSGVLTNFGRSGKFLDSWTKLVFVLGIQLLLDFIEDVVAMAILRYILVRAPPQKPIYRSKPTTKESGLAFF